MIWIGLGAMILGLAIGLFGLSRMRVQVVNSQGNVAVGTKGNVTQTYSETDHRPMAETSSGKSLEDRFLAWGGFLVAAAGLVIAIIPLVNH
jgi:hypothetical protein